MPDPSSLIRLRDLRFSYGNSFTLQLPNLEVSEHSRVLCIGPSGCGKTTFLHLLAGILPLQSGELQVLGRNLHDMNDARRRAFRIAHIGLVFQEFELLEYLTAGENLLLPYQINRSLKISAEVRQHAQRLTDRLGITQLLSRRPQALSQGERQRVALGRALITRPKLVLCDEPTGNLDPLATSHSIDLLFEQCKEAGATLLVVSHDHQFIDRFDQVIDFSLLATGGSA